MFINTLCLEKFILNYNVKVYPVTLLKFLLNRRRILTFMYKAKQDDFIFTDLATKVSDCKPCQETKLDYCRQHTSITRVLEEAPKEKIFFDIDTNLYFYKNEIFRMIDDKLVIVYCPHTKLIEGELNNLKVRKVSVITIKYDELIFPKYLKKVEIMSSVQLINSSCKCWFNQTFSIITIPNGNDFSNWCLISNH